MGLARKDRAMSVGKDDVRGCKRGVRGRVEDGGLGWNMTYGTEALTKGAPRPLTYFDAKQVNP